MLHSFEKVDGVGDHRERDLHCRPSTILCFYFDAHAAVLVGCAASHLFESHLSEPILGIDTLVLVGVLVPTVDDDDSRLIESGHSNVAVTSSYPFVDLRRYMSLSGLIAMRLLYSFDVTLAQVTLCTLC